MVFVLIMHLLPGFRRLRDVEYYADDPILKRVVGMDILPSVSAMSRPNGELTLTMSANEAVQRDVMHYLDAAA